MANKAEAGNSFTYTGEVTFKFVRNGKTYGTTTHNAGSQLLLDTITKALIGIDISKDLPKFLNFKGYKSDGKELELISRPIPFTGISYGEVAKVGMSNSSGGALLLNAAIVPEERGSAFAESIVKYRLCIQTADKRDLAYIEDRVLKDIYVALIAGSEVIIEWRMIFENK